MKSIISILSGLSLLIVSVHSKANPKTTTEAVNQGCEGEVGTATTTDGSVNSAINIYSGCFALLCIAFGISM